MNRNNIIVKDVEISYKKINEEDYICLTDIAKFKDPNHSGHIINNWLRNHSTIEYLGLWESMYNNSFKPTEFGRFKIDAGLNSFTLSPQEWVEKQMQ